MAAQRSPKPQVVVRIHGSLIWGDNMKMSDIEKWCLMTELLIANYCIRHRGSREELEIFLKESRRDMLLGRSNY